MKRASVARERGHRLFVLLEALRETERQIADLRIGIPDAPGAAEQRAFLSRRAKRQRRRTDIATQAAILEVLPASIAVLDATGIIVAVNSEWQKFDRAETVCGPGHVVGVNYLDVCNGATAESQTDFRVAKGIRPVLNATSPGFSMEYSCHLATHERWMALTVVPIGTTCPRGVVIMQVDVSAQRAIEGSLLAVGARFRQMADS